MAAIRQRHPARAVGADRRRWAAPGSPGFDPKGEAFDPEQHEAIAQTPVEGAESGTVVEVYQPGYRLNETVLRPAKVVVAA